MLEQLPESLALIVAGVILMVVVVVALSDVWDRRRAAKREKDSEDGPPTEA